MVTAICEIGECFGGDPRPSFAPLPPVPRKRDLDLLQEHRSAHVRRGPFCERDDNGGEGDAQQTVPAGGRDDAGLRATVSLVGAPHRALPVIPKPSELLPHASSNFNSPSFSRLQAILSPALSQSHFSLRVAIPFATPLKITPPGVPVKMTSPGRREMRAEV